MAVLQKKQYLDAAGLGIYDGLIKKYVDDADATSIHTVLVDGDNIKFYKKAGATAADTADYTVAIASSDVETLKAAVDKLNGEATVEGSVKKTVADVVKALEDGQVKTNKEAIEAINDAETGILALAKADTAAKVGSLDDLSTTAKSDVVAALNEVRASVEAGGTNSVVTVTTAETATEGYLKTYIIKQGTTEIGKIDIPKDLVVTAGEVVKNPEGQAEGTYVKLSIANQEAPIFINVADLVDVYTAAAEATQVQLAISATNEISATIVAGSIGATELAADAVTTVKVADGNITKAKLSTEVQASLDAADAAENGIVTAIEALDSTATQVAGTDGLAISIEQEDGKLKSVSASIAANTYDAHGAAETEAKAAYDAVEAVPEASIKALFN